MRQVRRHQARSRSGRLTLRKLLRGAAALGLVASIMAIGAAGIGAAPAPTVPVFVDGLSQAVFSNTTALHSEAWVEVPGVDSDWNGIPDRVHFDIQRPLETSTEGLKVPVILEASPYFANLGSNANWSVNHEVGFPPATRPAQTPFTIRNTSPSVSTDFNSTWVPRGFAVLHADSLGTGWSTGCPTDGANNETLGVKAVIDWTQGRATAYTSVDGTTQVASPDWTTDHVGMMGTSYNATLPIAAATTGVEGLDAIVPISPVVSYYDYYRENGMTRGPGGFQGEDADVLVDVVNTRRSPPAWAIDTTYCRPIIQDMTAHLDRASGDYTPFWNDRNLMNDVDKVHAAVLIAHGNNDENVTTKQSAMFYEAIKARGIPHMFYFHQGGHGGGPPDPIINKWFSHYLYGVDNGVDALPRSWVVRETNACPPRTAVVSGDQSNTRFLTVANSAGLNFSATINVPQLNSNGTTTTTTRVITDIPDSTHVTLVSAVATTAGQKVADGATLSVTNCSTTNPTPYAEWPDPATGPAKVHLTNGAPTRGGLTFRAANPAAAAETLSDAPTVTATTDMNAASSANRLIYQSPVLTKDVRISGTVWIDVRTKFSKNRANLTGVLMSYPGTTGNGTIIARGWQDPDNPDSPAVTVPYTAGDWRQLRFDLQPKDEVIVAGRRLAIMILASDQEHTVRPAAGTQLTVDLASSEVTLPVVGGETYLAQAFGATGPTIGSTLNPASPTGANGWYTGDVSLTWQVGDGGAATTKTGCDDETFSVDGTYTRSCSASNLLGAAGPVDVTVKRDATAPGTSAATSPASPDGTNGWFRTAPTVTLSASDATSGVAATSYSLDGGPATAYAGPISGFSEGAHVLTFSSTDNAGNAEATQVLAFTVDTAAPDVTGTVSPAAPDGLDGWYVTNPTVTVSASDGGSGVASTEFALEGETDWNPYAGPFQVCGLVTPGRPPVGCKYPPPPPPWGDGHRILGRASDEAGNVGQSTLFTLKVDLDLPVTAATLTPGLRNGWYASPTLTLTGSDGHSGIAHTDYSLDGGAWGVYAGPVSGFSNGNHFVQYRSTDLAGHVEAVQLIAFKVDPVKPSVNITAPADGASIPQDKVTTAKFKCTDGESGMDTCVGTVANGANLPTGTVGDHAFTVTGTDMAGNVTVKTVHYLVTYTWNGFFSPVTNTETSKLNLVHAGDLIRLGFSLNGDRGLSVFGAGYPASTVISCPSWPPHSVPAAGDGATTGLSFGVASGHYTYGWQTNASWAGTCRRFELQLDDGTSTLHTADFMFFA